MRSAAAFLLTCMLLPACGNPQAVDLRSQLTPAQLEQVQQPLLLAEIEGINAMSTLIVKARNGEAVTWESGDRVSLTFRDGVLIGTRGLGDDLMSADVDNTLRMLAGRPMPEFYTRFQSRLDGEFQTAFRSFQCRRIAATPESITIVGRVHQTVRTDERCVSPGLEVTNSYWRDATGFQWKSRQWISENAGYLLSERLVR